MSDRERENLLVERALEELRTLPAVAPDVASRVARAALASGGRIDEGPAALAPAPVRRRWTRWTAYVGLAAAACLLGYFARGVLHPPRRTVDASARLAAPAVPIADGTDADARPLPTQFVFRSRTARRVALVADFNGWNPSATPLQRVAGSGMWAVTLPVAPGRHGYAFLVDDTLFALDPHAPTVRDRDLGTTASEVVVGRP